MGEEPRETVAIVVAGGRGERLHVSSTGPAGQRPLANASVDERMPPKAFVDVAGKPLLAWSIESLCASPEVSAVLPVVPASHAADFGARVPTVAAAIGVLPPVVGGATRQESVAAGLAALPADTAWVAVHDAARPLVSPDAIGRVVAAAVRRGAAILALPVQETIKLVDADRVRSTPPRSDCYAAQTPQVFRVDWLREAHAKAAADGFVGTDDAELVERLGMPVHIVPGERENRKVTDAEDLAWAAARLAARRA
jgi:2-C-methyl-D-erythritol 4-phosphate cytidylyltransferase